MKIKIGDLVELYSEKCGFSKLSPEDVFGINKEKKFFSPTVQEIGRASCRERV